jgi:hypothetical protein
MPLDKAGSKFYICSLQEGNLCANLDGYIRLDRREGAMDREYRFRIAASYTPSTLPLERLAEYMVALARLLGEEPNVHFSRIEGGSAVVVAVVEEPAQPKVHDRVCRVRDGTAPLDALKAYADLDDLLRKDNATGMLAVETGGVLIEFPGRTRPEPLVFGPFRQDGSMDGQVLRVGGRDDTVPVHLREGPVVHTGLHASPELARRIAHHLLGHTVRVHGTGTWFRAGDGSWELKSFKIVDFEVLGDAPLDSTIATLRKVRGNQWNEIPDPVRALIEERHDDGDAH